MPTTKTAKKRLRQSSEKRVWNRSVKHAISTHRRNVLEALQSGDLATAEKAFALTAKQLDRAATKHVIHANAAARTKSRLSAKIKKAKKK